jgi:hypothetical protein
MADFQQALPHDYPDLQTLLEVMPGSAAQQIGFRQRTAEANNQALQNAFAAQEQYNAQKRPLDLAQLMATTENAKSQSRMHNASAIQQELKNDIESQTKQSHIQAILAGNKTRIGAEDIAQLEQTGDLYRQAGAAAALETDPYRKIATVKRILGNHVNQTPEFDRFLLENKDMLHQHLTDMGDNVYDATRAALAARRAGDVKKSVAETGAASRESVAQAANQSRENVAAINAASKLEQLHDKAVMDQRNRSSALEEMASREQDPQKKAELLRQANEARAFASYMAQIAAQARNETGINTSAMIPGTTPPKETLPIATGAAAVPTHPTQNPTIKPEHLKVLEAEGMGDSELAKTRRAQFNNRYGAGAAEAYLKGK